MLEEELFAHYVPQRASSCPPLAEKLLLISLLRGRHEEGEDELKYSFPTSQYQDGTFAHLSCQEQIRGGGDVKKYSFSSSQYQVGTLAHLFSPRWLTMMRTTTALENLLSSLVKRFEEPAAKALSPIS